MTACLMSPADVGLLIVDETTSGVGDEARRILAKLREIAIQYLTAPGTSATFRSSIEAVLDAAAEAKNENWDGSGSAPISEAAATNAIRLLRHIPGTIPVPDAFADSHGDLVLDWSRSPRCTFSVAVSSRGELHFAGIFGSSRLHGREPFFTDELPDQIRSGLLRVFRD